MKQFGKKSIPMLPRTGTARKAHPPAYRPTSRLLLALASALLLTGNLYGQTAPKDTAHTGWVTGGSAGPSFPVGSFGKVSNVGFHYNTLTEWHFSRHCCARGLFDFSTYGFQSSSTQEGFAVTHDGNRTLITVLVDVGYRTRWGKWTPGIYVGNGLSYYTIPVLTASPSERRVSSKRQDAFYYALHAGLLLEYALSPQFTPFLELSTTCFPGASLPGTRFVVLQPMVGVKVPLKGIVNSVFYAKNNESNQQHWVPS